MNELCLYVSINYLSKYNVQWKKSSYVEIHTIQWHLCKLKHTTHSLWSDIVEKDYVKNGRLVFSEVDIKEMRPGGGTEGLRLSGLFLVCIKKRELLRILGDR